jgi:hypothetical protein
MNLGVLDRTLERPAGDEAKQNLIADPLACAGIAVHGVEQSTGHGCHAAAEDPEEWDNANSHQGEALDNHGDGERYDHGKHTNT